MTNNNRVLVIALAVAVLLLVPASAAFAYPWSRTLKEGDSGKDVKALQVRVSGWFPRSTPEHFPLDGHFSSKATEAVKAFQSFYGLPADGIAGPSTFAMLDSLEDADGSTIHFDFSEFKQNTNSSCSAQANAYAGTFKGGMVAARVVKRNVKRLMWRLEAVRAKAGGKAVGINSGYRSVAYNDCIGGARASQHMYGTAADNRMAEVSNRMQRDLAKQSQIQGIGCYSSLSHNHFDLRVDNPDYSYGQSFWWPRRDDQGRDLDEAGKPCYGETSQTGKQRGFLMPTDTDDASFWGSLVPSLSDLRTWEAAGEPVDLGAAD